MMTTYPKPISGEFPFSINRLESSLELPRLPDADQCGKPNNTHSISSLIDEVISNDRSTNHFKGYMVYNGIQ